MAVSAFSGTCFCFPPSSIPRRNEVVDSSSEKSELERSLGTSCWIVLVLVPRRILRLLPLRRLTRLLFRDDDVGRVVGGVGCVGDEDGGGDGGDGGDDDDDTCIACS